MTLAELTIAIKADETNATDALRRTQKMLREAQADADFFGAAFAASIRAAQDGGQAAQAASRYYGATAAELKAAAEAATNYLASVRAQKEAQSGLAEAAQRGRKALHDARMELLAAQAQGPLDTTSVALYGKLFEALAPKSQEFVRTLADLRRETQDIKESGLPAYMQALGVAINQATSIAADAQRRLSDGVRERLTQTREEIAMAGTHTEAERVLWQTQEGRLKGVHPWIQAILELQAKQLDQAKALDAASRHTGGADDRQAALTTNRLVERLADLRARVGELTGAGAGWESVLRQLDLDTSQLTARQKGLIEQISKLSAVRDHLQAFSQGMRSFIGDMLNDLYQRGFKGFFASVVQGFADMIRRMTIAYWQSELTRGLMRGIAGLFGAAVGGVTKSTQNLPARATGGPVMQDSPYLVGEAGPEVFVPAATGTVLPLATAAAGAGSQGGTIVHNHIHISTPDVAAFRHSVGQIASETGYLIQRSLRRGG